MKRIIRRGTAILLLLCAVCFGGVGYGRFAIPDTVPVLSPQEDVLPLLYDFSPQSSSQNVRFLHAIAVKSSRVQQVEREYAVPLGRAFGIKLYTQGVLVVRTDAVDTAQGSFIPAKRAGIREGDTLLAVGGETIRSNAQIAALFAASGGKPLTVRVRRESAEFDTMLVPMLSQQDGKYHAGLWVRDSSAGIGTMTFFAPQYGIFGALGHAVCDVDTGRLMPLSGGEAVNVTVKGSYKGRSGDPGELCGMFERGKIGQLLQNNESGVYGRWSEPDSIPDALPVAMYYEVQPGEATLLAEVDEGGVRAYTVQITKLYRNPDAKQKNLIVKVTDPELIARTGGIVQGMSGSPIVQNGMLVGAVTHVFVSDPLQGFGIYAQTMLAEAKSLAQTKDAA